MRIILICVLVLFVMPIAAQDEDEPVGACVVDSDYEQSCTDDVGEDQCRHDIRHGGSFHPDTTCEELEE